MSHLAFAPFNLPFSSNPTNISMSLARIPRSHRASFIPLPLSGLRARRIRNSDRTPSRRAVDVSAVEAAAEGGSWTDLLAILALSAAPFVIVQALADSDRGKVLQEKLAAEMVQLKKDSAQWTKDRVAARRDSRWFGADRPKFLGPLGFDYPEHLRGELPGDYGFDPLNLAADPAKLEKYFELEILHARWAMLAVVGALVPEILAYSHTADLLEPVWWRVGKAKLEGDDLDYLGIPGLHIAGGQGIAIIVLCQLFLMGGPEYARSVGIKALEPLGIYLPGQDINYPGSVLFDPFNLSKDPVAFEEYRVKEIKNGRIAMVAFLAFFIQAYVTQKGPIENLLDSLAGSGIELRI